MNFQNFARDIGTMSSPDSLYQGKTFNDIGVDEDLTRFLHKKLDPDGSKFGGDTKKLKEGFLNDQTFRSNSITAQTIDWVNSRNADQKEKLEGNLMGRLYESADNRLLSGNLNDTTQALWAGLKGGVVGEGGGDLIINALMSPAVLAKAGIGFAARGASSVARTVLGKEAVKEGLKEGASDAAIAASKEAATTGWHGATAEAMKQGFKQEAALNVPLSVGADALEQAKGENFGLQDEYSILQGVGAGALGAGFGGAIGAVTNIPMGRRVGREMTGEAPLKDLKPADGQFAPTIEGERARLEQVRLEEAAKANGIDAQNPEIFGGVRLKDFEEQFGSIKEDIADRTAEATTNLRERAGQIAAGSFTDTIFKSDTVAAMASVLGRINNDPAASLKHQADKIVKAGAIGDATAQGIARTEGESLYRLFKWVQDNPNGFAETDTKIPDDLVEALVLRDLNLANLVGRDRAADAASKAAAAGVPPASAAPGPKAPPAGPAAPSSPAGGPSPGPATPPASAPSQGGAGPVSPQAPTPPTAGPDVTVLPDGTLATITRPAPEPGKKISDVESVLTDKEKGAVSDLNDLASKASTTADEVLARVDAGEAPTSIAADLAVRSGAEPAQANQIVSTATVSVQRARQRRAAQPGAAPTPEPTAAAPAGTATPPAAAAQTPAQEAPSAAAADVADEALDTAGFTSAAQGAVAERFNLAAMGVQQNLSEALKLVNDDLTPDRLGQLQADPEMGPLFAGIDTAKLASEQGRNAVKAEMQRIARASVSTYIADTVSRVMPDPLNTAHFERLLTLFPGVSETVRRNAVEDFGRMARHALAEEVGRLGSVDAVVAKYGPEAQKLLGEQAPKKRKGKPLSETAEKMEAMKSAYPAGDSVNMKALVEGIEGEARSFVMKQLRDFKQQLDLSPIRSSPELMESALARRAQTALADFAERDWAGKNPDDARRLAALRSMRETSAANRQQALAEVIRMTGFDSVTAEDLSGQLVNVSWTGGINGTRGAVFDNPVVERLRPGGKWGRLVQGRIQSRQVDGTIDATNTMQGVLTPTIGNAFFGSLFAHPNRAMLAGFRARNEIHLNGIQRASTQAKERLGLNAETINQRVEFARMQGIINQQRKRMAGEITEDQFKANIERISTHSRAVRDDEIAIAADFLNLKDQIDKANESAKVKVADVMDTLAAGGLSQDDVVAKILTGLQESQAKLGPQFLSSVEKLVDPAARVTDKQKRVEARQAKKDGKVAEPETKVERPNPEPNATVSVRTGDKVVRELRAAKEIDFNADGTLTLFGKRIGTWTPGERKMKNIQLDGYTGPAMQPVSDTIGLAKRKSFQKHPAIAKILDANINDLPETDVRVTPEAGDVIPESASRAKEIDDAVSEVVAPAMTPEQLSTPYAAMSLPEGRRFVLINKSNGRVFHVTPELQPTPAATLGQYLNEGEWELGTIPAGKIMPNGKFVGARQVGDAFAKAQFVPYGRDPGNADQRLIERTRLDAQNKNVLPEILKAQRGPVDLKTLAKIPVGLTDQIKTAADLVNAFDSLSMRLRVEDIPTKASYDELLGQLTDMAKKIEEIAPHGIDRGNVGRRTAHHWLRTHLRGADPADVNAAVDFLRRLDVDARGLPYFEKSELYPSGTVVNGVDVSGRPVGDYFASKANRIGLDAAGQLTDQLGRLVVPRHISVVHETAHWAFLNMLSPSEQVQFVRSLEKYFADGKFNREQFVDDMPGLNELMEATGKRPVGSGTNELFAWQFTSWYLQKARNANVAGEETLWRKVVHYVKNILSKMAGGGIDPDVIPLFERIMPSSPMEQRYEYSALRDLRGEGKLVPSDSAVDPRHASAMRKMDVVKQLDELRRKLDEHLFDPTGSNVAGMAADLKEAGTTLFLNIYPFKGKATLINERLSNALVGRVNPDAKKTRELFGVSGTGAIMDAFNAVKRAAGQDIDAASAFGEMVDGVVDGMPGMTLLAKASDNPEMLIQLAQETEKILAEILAKAPGTEKALAASAADTYARRMLGIADEDASSLTGAVSNATVDTNTAALIRKMTADVRDMLMDGMDSLSAFIEDDGYALVKNRRHMAETPPAAPKAVVEEVADAIDNETQARVDKAIDQQMKRYEAGQRMVNAGKVEEGEAMMDAATDEILRLKGDKTAKARAAREEQMPDAPSEDVASPDLTPEERLSALQRPTSTLQDLQKEAIEAVTKAVEGKTGAAALAAEQAAMAPFYDAIRIRLSANKELPNQTSKFAASLANERDIDVLKTTYEEAISGGNALEILAVEARLREVERIQGKKPSVAPDNSEAAMNLRRLDADIARESVAPSDLAPGIPPVANPQLKNLLSRITHRKHATRDTSRRMAYRLLKVLGVEEPTNGQLADILGKTGGVDRPDTLAVGSPVAKEFIGAIREFAEMATLRVENDGTALNASDAAGGIADAILSGRMKEEGFEARMKAFDKDFEALRRLPEEHKSLSEIVRLVASSYYDRAVLKDKDALTLKTLSDAAPNLFSFATDIAKEARWVVEGAVSAKQSGDKLHLGVMGSPAGRGQHPAFAARQVGELIDSLDDGMLTALGAKLGLSGDEATRGRIARSVMYHQPGSASRVGMAGTGSVRLSMAPDTTMGIREAARLMDSGADASKQALMDGLNAVDQRMMDPSVDATKLRQLGLKRDAILTVLRREHGSDFSDAAVPMMVDVERLFDLGPHENKMQLAIVARAYAASVNNPQALASLSDIVAAGDGRKLYETISGAVGKQRADKLLAEAGYIGTRMDTGAEVFDAQSVKTMLDEVDFGSRTIPESEMVRSPITGELFLGLVGDLGDKTSAAGAQSRGVLGGMTEKIAAVTSKVTSKGRQRLNGDDVKAIVDSGWGLQISDQPSRMRKSGANHMADLSEGFYESRDSFLGRHLAPAVRALDKIAGNHNPVAKYISEIKRNGKFWSSEVPQSDAESRIARAMLGGDAAVAKLNDAERAVAMQLRDSFFKPMLKKLQEAGLQTRDITGGDQGSFYLPHRFNIEAMTNSPEKAIKAFTEYFQRENPEESAISVRERATKMVTHAINDFEHGGYLGGTTYARAFGEGSYQRVLRMTPAEMERLGLIDFFDTNLRSLVISYGQGAANRIEVSKRFGLGGHVHRTYLNIATEGETAAIEALLQRKQFEPVKVSQNAGQSVSFPVELYKSLTDDENEARQIVGQVTEILSGKGSPETLRKAASQYLQALYESKGYPGSANFAKASDAIVSALSDFTVKGQLLSGKEASWIEAAVNNFAGKPAYMTGRSESIRNISGGLMAFNNITLLSTSVLASIPDIGMSLFRSGSFGAYSKGLAKTVLEARNYDSAYRNSMRDLGLTMEAILNENVTNAHGGKIGRLGNGFFYATGLTPWTNAMREMAAATGFYSMKASQEMLKRLRANGETDSIKYRQGMRYLRQLGAAHLLDAPQLDDIGKALETDDLLRTALLKFTNESVFQPNKSDIPLWAQDPLGKLLFQFKSYPLMFGRMTKRAFNEAIAFEKPGGGDLSFGEILRGVTTGGDKWRDAKYAGDPMQLLTLATVGVGLGAGAQYVRDVLQGRNQEADPGSPSSEWHTSRERLISKILDSLGLPAEWGPDDPRTDEALGVYMEGLIGLGAMGMVGDLIYQSAANIDNGAFGQWRIASLLFGPSVGTFNDGLNAVAGVASMASDALDETDEGETNAKERTGIRALVGRIPVAGRIATVREQLVNDFAGESEILRQREQ